jgi:hypothetical protein
MPNKPKFIYEVSRSLPKGRDYLTSTDPTIDTIRHRRKLLGIFLPSRNKVSKEVVGIRNRLLEKYPIELKIDPLKGAQLIVEAQTKEKADQIIKSFSGNINKALYKKYGVSELTCEYLPE